MPILACICFTFNWLTLTSEMHFVKFHPEVASCLLSRGKRKYAPLGMRLLWKYIRNYFLVYHLISHFLLYLQNYKEFEAEILDLQSEKYGLSFDMKKYTTYGWAQGDENVIGIRTFKCRFMFKVRIYTLKLYFLKSTREMSHVLVIFNFDFQYQLLVHLKCFLLIQIQLQSDNQQLRYKQFLEFLQITCKFVTSFNQ